MVEEEIVVMGSMSGILFAVVGFEDEGRFVLGSEVVFSN